MDTYLIKHHQNSGAELLQPEVLEQSSSKVEQSHAKHALSHFSCLRQLNVSKTIFLHIHDVQVSTSLRYPHSFTDVVFSPPFPLCF
jgi:hypothetical protein